MPTEPEHIHICTCQTPGMQMGDDAKCEQLPDGRWLATQPIGYIFGSEVDGECQGVGSTKEEALDALKKDKDKLYESLWF